MVDFKISDTLGRLVKDLSERAKTADPDIIRKGIEDAMKLSRDEAIEAVRKGEFNVDDVDPRITNMNVLIRKRTKDESVKKIQQINDDLLIMSVLCQKPVKTFELYKSLKPLINESELAKAMTTGGAGTGAEWIPTDFSAELVDLFNLELKVAASHRDIMMPSDPFKFGRKTSRSTAKKATEASEATATTPGTGALTLTAETLISRVDVSYELEEESIIPMLPTIKEDIAQALGHGVENCDINGDTTTTHQDSDVTEADDARKCWKGYRKHCLAAAKYNVGGDAVVEGDLQAVRILMGKYGVNPDNLIWVVGISTFNAMLNKTNFSSFRTVDKYGPMATVLRGELGKFDNIPVICSEYIREDLNASAVYDGTGNALTEAILVFRPGFLHGTRRAIKLEMENKPSYQKNILVATTRKAFTPRFDETTEKIVAIARNILA